MKTVSKSVKYEFSQEETRHNAKELARNNHALVEAELKRKQITSDLKADEQRIVSEIAKLSRWVNDGHDFRSVECRVAFNYPKNGIKTFYRKDTGELVESINMEPHEMQENLPLADPADEDDGDLAEPDGQTRPY